MSTPSSARPGAGTPPTGNEPVAAASRPARPAGAAPSRPAPRIFGLPVATAKILLFIVGLLPFARWVLLGFTEGFGANPTEFLTRSSGTWTLVSLLVTLAITPLRQLTGQQALVRLRRMAGLFAFFYASVHFTTYFWFDQWFDVPAMLADVAERPFILMGFSAFVLLIPLAATSTQAAMRRLGRRWGMLHKLIYLIGVLAILHYWWHKAGKNDFREVGIYAAVLAGLLLWRVVWPRIQAARRRT